MRGGYAAAKFAAEIAEKFANNESNYTFKNVLMVSPYWQQADKVTNAIENAKNYGVKFYASYSYNEGDYEHPGDTKTTRTFVKDTLAKYLDADPWHLPAVHNHGTTVWDVATFDGDEDGRADIWEVILGDTNLNENEEETSTTITEG